MILRNGRLGVKNVNHKKDSRVMRISARLSNRNYPDKKELELHVMNAHMNFKPFKCKICNTPFTKSSSLEYHIGVKHLGFTAELAKANRKLARAHEAYEVLASVGYFKATNPNKINLGGKGGKKGRPKGGIAGALLDENVASMPQKEATSDIKVKEDPLDTSA